MDNNNITLYNGDCLTELNKVADGSVDLVLCDLPYEVTQNQWDCVIDPVQLWTQYKRVCKPESTLVFTATFEFATTLYQSNPDWFRYDIVWRKNKKTGFLNAKLMPLRQHELILVFGQKAGRWYPQKTRGHNAVNYARKKQNGSNYGKATRETVSGGATDRYPASVLDFAVVNNDDPEKIHPTQKPVELMEYLIKSYTKQGDLVLDNSMGSGSTGVACLHSHRRFVGIDKDPIYFEKARARIEEQLRRRTEQPMLLEEPEEVVTMEEIDLILSNHELI